LRKGSARNSSNSLHNRRQNQGKITKKGNMEALEGNRGGQGKKKKAGWAQGLKAWTSKRSTQPMCSTIKGVISPCLKKNFRKKDEN